MRVGIFCCAGHVTENVIMLSRANKENFDNKDNKDNKEIVVVQLI